MSEVLAYYGAFIGLGVLWRWLTPMRLPAADLQRALVGYVHGLVLPFYFLVILWQTPLTLGLVRQLGVLVLATVSVFLLAWIWLNGQKRWTPQTKGALLLAASFGNVVYLGLPLANLTDVILLETTIAYGALVILPLALVATALIAYSYSARVERVYPMRDILSEPVVWGIAAGLILNSYAVGMPVWLGEASHFLAAGVLSMMLISVGLGLRWDPLWRRLFVKIWPLMALQLVITPILIGLYSRWFSVSDHALIESMMFLGAMPSMVLGFVFCERYSLDKAAYGLAFVATHLVSLATLPLWYLLLF